MNTYRIANTKVSITDLRTQLGVYLSGVKSGGEIVVTEHGHPIARITPVTRGGEWDTSLTEKGGAGLVRDRISVLTGDFHHRARPVDARGDGVGAILADRAAGR